MVTDQELAGKLAILDARDKRLRQQMTKQTELSKASAYIGTCDDMCPERERYLRLGFQLSIFERDENNQPDEYAMVKEYRRAGADQEEPLPHDLRTPKALETTIDYLVCNIMDDSRSKYQELALEWYDFLWDRLRAIRKDITQQNICDEASAILVERCTRFHVHSCYAMNRIKDFDVDMNKRNLNDCLQMLRQMYNDLRITGTICEGELEFQKYDILLHLDEDHLSTNVLMKTSDHRSLGEMKFITQVFNAYTNNDYYKFFKLMKQADYMTSCILGLYVNKVRLMAIKIIIAACTSRQAVLYPADIVIDTLGFDQLEDLKAFASTLDIETKEKDSKHYLVLTKDLITSIRRTGPSLMALKSTRLVESKMLGRCVGQLVYGQQELPKNPYRQPMVTRSLLEEPMEVLEVPEEIVADFGSSSVIEAEMRDESKPETTWFEDPKPITENMFNDRHLKIVDLPTKNPDTTKQVLKINNLKPVDAAAYHIKAENPTGPHLEVESEPSNVRLDRSMGPRDEPVVTEGGSGPGEIANELAAQKLAPTARDQVAPTIVSMPEEVVAGAGSSPEIVAEVSDKPEPQLHEETATPQGKPPKSFAEAAKIMPAGRFRRKTIKRPVMGRRPLSPKPLPQRIKRSVNQDREIEAFHESINDEKKANKDFYDLIKRLFNGNKMAI